MSHQPLRRVLIVDDEPAVREMLAVALEMAGFEVKEAEDASTALHQVASSLPDLMLIDWMMPQVSGLELCRRLRRNPDTANIPLILLTARGEEDAKITGLEVADDYITKPFSPRELVARLKAILRRTTPKGVEEPVEFAKLRLDPVGQRVTAFGQLLTLSPIEYRLLQLFMTNPDRAFSRTQLLDRVWGGDVYVEERTVDVHIRRLRKALGSAHEDLIQTVRGTGYRFTTTELEDSH
ncbi:MAG: phosphate regulon transcriptional regulator PhoB [Oceanospirillales bacterium]|jgi:two-component system phosphate regulon response regulator PhoB|nr:phosphate regulon transcriptional regulator PhoB [Oceanospirillales bacterium]MCH1500781.1 phosphate regulon transcriptional regulator PhoB [Litorivicinaceae bacterium]